MQATTLAFASIVGLGLVCQWIAWRTKLPAILFLLLAGLAIGPGMHWLNPDELLGELLFPVVSLSVAIILFEGSLTLKVDEIRGLTGVVQKLMSLGVVLSWAMISLATHFIMGYPWPLACLFGAIVLVTGPTVIIPILRSVRPNSRIANVLRWEGIVIDPIGALMAVLVYEYVVSYQTGGALGHSLLAFARIVLIGGTLGFLAGFCLGNILQRQWLPDYLHNLATISLVLLSFSFANTLEPESGLFAVTVMGFSLANMRNVEIEDILSFKEHLSVLLISVLFIILAARVQPADLLKLGLPALVLMTIMQLVIRPISVWLCSLGSDLSWQEKALIAWISPRGIVAAAVSALFALRLEQHGFDGAEQLIALTFAVILGTVILQSASARILAQLLKVAEPAPRGVLIIGANQVARELAKTLQQHNIKVLLADSNWFNISASRMDGLNTFYGNPISEYADSHLDLVGIGQLIAASPQRDLNTLASLRYRPEFGREKIFTLVCGNDTKGSSKHIIAKAHKGNTFADETLTFTKFSSLLSQGAKLRSTTLTDSFDFAALTEENDAIHPLFALDKKNRLHIFSPEKPISPNSGWQVISLDYQQLT